MTQAKERLLTDTHSENDCIVLDLEEFDLSDLDALKNTALGNILEINFQNPMATSHNNRHNSHSSHGQFDQSLWG
jgi:hypothetical protein